MKDLKLSYLSIVGAFIAFIIILGCTKVIDQHHSQFFERDPALSYYFNGDQVPSKSLHYITYPISFGFVVAFTIFSRKYDTSDFKSFDLCNCLPKFWRNKLVVLITFAIGLGSAILACHIVTIIMKKIVGRARPSAFYLCNYKGYADAVDSGDFTTYDSLTVANALGDVSHCYGDPTDAFSSFPSGHSSESFVTMVFSTLLLRNLFDVSLRSFMSVENLLAFGPVVIAAWICVTRLTDNKHHVDDVMAGAIIGTVCGVLGYFTVDEWMETAAGEYDAVVNPKKLESEGGSLEMTTRQVEEV